MSERVFTIHVCPECGYYTADPILRRTDGIHCFQCGWVAERTLDLSRINPNYRSHRRREARLGAPLLVPTRVVAFRPDRQETVASEDRA